jgi:putative DNA primase/helicase
MPGSRTTPRPRDWLLEVKAEDYFSDRGKFIPAKMAEDVIKSQQFVTPRDTGDIYVWNEDLGVYSPQGEELIRESVAEILGERHKKGYAEEVVYHVRVSTYYDRTELHNPPHLLVLENGVLNLETKELKPYNPEIFTLNRLPVRYDPDAQCPRIMKFLSEILTPHDIPIIQELTGYCLLRDHRFQKAFMFVGGGRNGKSTLIRLFKAFLGKENISSVSLHDLNTRRFAAAELYQKMANLYADLPDKSLTYTGIFKMLTGGDPILAERKYKNPFLFENYAKLIFSTNKMPEANDDTVAFFRRWIIVNFPNEFPPDKADPQILEKLTTPEELSGFLNWALEGLDRLLKQGQFSRSETVDEVMDTWQRMSAPTYAFLEDMTIIDAPASTPKDELYAAYIEYCQKNGLPTTAKNIFARDLPRYRPNISVERKTVKGRRVQCWRGIGLRDVKDVKDVKVSLHPNRARNGFSRKGVEKNLDILDNIDTSREDLGELSEDEETVLKILKRETQRGRDVGYFVLKGPVEYRLGKRYRPGEFEAILRRMDVRGLVDFDGNTVKLGGKTE